MIITKVEVRLIGLGFRNCIVVEIQTDNGLRGFGETVLKRRSKTVEANLHELSRFLVGRDATAIEDLHEKMYRDSFWVGGPLHASAISAVDVALWDLKGKSLQVPIYQLLGGPTRSEIPVYCHCSAGDSPRQFAQNLKQCREWGYHAAKTTLPLFYGSSAYQPESEPRGYSGLRGQIPASWRARLSVFGASIRVPPGASHELSAHPVHLVYGYIT